MYRSLFLIFTLIFFMFVSFCYSATTCINSDCHTNLTKMAFLHGPLAANECNVCHIAKDDDVKKHATKPKSFVDFAMPKEKPICVMCHDTKFDGEFVHEPVKTGDCLSCHNPHGGANKFFLNGKNESETCFQCHENNKTTKSFLHGPVGTGECASCHNPHTSNYKFQLKSGGNSLCFTCHSDKEESFKKKVVHKPAQTNCVECHEPHNSNTKFHLKAASEREQCINCHKNINVDVVNNILQAKYQHKPVKDDKCGTCHSPHATNHSKLLIADTKNICFECHKDIEDKIKKSKYVHAPVSSDGCYACHNTHGSNNPFILVKYFPKEFYNQYNSEIYDLCFNCHNDAAMKFKIAHEETNFRNGNINLHYLHVQIKGKGRSCKACHEVHAGNQELHIRSSVPFGSGKWELPIQFSRSKTGGTCIVGCHKPKTYDREKEYINN